MISKADTLIFSALVAVTIAAAGVVYILSETVVGVSSFSRVENVEAATTVAPPSVLKIPSLNIEADIQKVGQNSKGNMGMPARFNNVAWYKHGTTPGQMGSAVIAGHLDNALALPGAFYNLHKLKPGDKVEVVTADGTTLHFKVEEVKLYKYEEVPNERIFNRSDKPRLNLITCAGTWDNEAKMYSERLVVYTTMVQ